MRYLHYLLSNLFRKKVHEEQLDAELRSYLELIEEEKRKNGRSPETARREALLELGGLEQVKENVRDVRAGRFLEHFTSDVRHGWRMILRMRLTASVVVLSLGVGIGVNTAIFTWIQTVFFQPMPGVSEASSFQHVETRAEGGSYPGMSWLEYHDVQDGVRSFRDLLAFRMVPLYIGERGRAERVFGSLVSANYFTALGLTPYLGRFTQPEEVSRPGGEPVAVISYEFWRSHYGASGNALGQIIRVNEYPLTIIGVTPPRFQGTVLGLDFSIWTPATMAPMLLGGSRELVDRDLRGYSVMGRLRQGANRTAVQAELDGVMQRLAHTYPATNTKIQGEVLSFWEAPRGPQRLLARSLAILQAVMLLLLLAVCGNIASLTLARTTVRLREIGVRLAIGAEPWRIRRLLLTESLILAFLGSCLGAAIAVWGSEALRIAPMIGAFPIRFQTRVDAMSVAFAMALGLVCGLIFGALPAIRLSRTDPQDALRSGSVTVTLQALRNALIGAEVALALVVLIVAALFFRSFRETKVTDPGFARDGVLLAGYDLNGRNVTEDGARAFSSKLVDRLRALPAVKAAAVATSVPLDIHGMPLMSFTVQGHERTSAAPDRALTNTVTPGYFATMGIPLSAGRDFADLNDSKASAQAIVNEAFVRRYLERVEPVGRVIEARGRRYEITGVVKDSVYDSFGERPTPLIYLSYRDGPAWRGEIHLRTRAGAEKLLISDVSSVVRELDPTLNLIDARTMNEHIERNAFLRRIPAQMFVILGPLLMVLAAIGIYAVVAYSVAQRTKEIGLRLALGATGARVTAQIVRETMGVVTKGLLIGWTISFMVAIHVARGGIDLAAFLGVPAVLFAVGTLACLVPAYRASKLNPVVALSHQ